MKRIIYLFLSVLLIVLSVILLNGEDRLIEESEKQVAKYGGIYFDDEGNIISLYAYHGKEAFLKNMASVTALGKKSTIPVYLAIPPRKMDVLEIPDDINLAPSRALFDLAKKECERSGVEYIDLLGVLEGEDYYFATDNHWSSKGAYIAYCEIIRAMGHEPIAESEFTIDDSFDTYRGNDYWKTKPKDYDVYDTIELYYPEVYGQYKTVLVGYPYDSDEGNEEIELFDIPSLHSDYPYGVYFKGNAPYVTIRNGEERETLLVIRDSFASALAPLLVNHYDIVLIDPRFCADFISKIAEREGASVILVLENMGSYTENTVKFAY